MRAARPTGLGCPGSRQAAPRTGQDKPGAGEVVALAQDQMRSQIVSRPRREQSRCLGTELVEQVAKLCSLGGAERADRSYRRSVTRSAASLAAPLRTSRIRHRRPAVRDCGSSRASITQARKSPVPVPHARAAVWPLQVLPAGITDRRDPRRVRYRPMAVPGPRCDAARSGPATGSWDQPQPTCTGELLPLPGRARRQRCARDDAADPSARPARSASVTATSRACRVGFEPGVGVSMNRP